MRTIDPRWAAVAFGLSLLPACFNPEPHAPQIGACSAACAASSTTEIATSMGAPDLGPHEQGTSSSTAEPGTSSTGSMDTSSSTDDGTTAVPLAGFLEPCTAHGDCESGTCIAGSCSQFCWSQVYGETPCPGPPASAPELEIVCDRLSAAPSCEGCFDCALYCIARCSEDAQCPPGNACVLDTCGTFGRHCAPDG